MKESDEAFSMLSLQYTHETRMVFGQMMALGLIWAGICQRCLTFYEHEPSSDLKFVVCVEVNAWSA